MRRSPSVGAGHIVAVMGLKDTTTGETLCDPSNPVILESMDFPAPVIHVAIEPKTKSDQEKLGTAIQRLSDEDPTFQVRTDEETGQTIIAGMGELHLEVLVDRMRREFNVEANVGKPQVAYRETITQARSRRSTTPTRSRPVGPASSPRCRSTSSRRRARARAATSSSTRSPVAASRASTSRRWTPAARRPWSTACSPGYPMVDVKVTLRDGAVPRRRLLRARLQDRRLDGVQGRRPPGRPRAARADDGRRGDHARGLHG